MIDLLQLNCLNAAFKEYALFSDAQLYPSAVRRLRPGRCSNLFADELSCP